MRLPRAASAIPAAGLAAVTLLADPGVAFAAWAAHGTGQALARATGLTSVTGVTATATGSSVRVDWLPAGLTSGTAAAGYRVVRYAPGSSTPETIGAGCSGLRESTGCTETSVPDGTWQYAVRAVQGGWSGRAGVAAPVTVATVVTPGAAAVTFPAAGSKHGPATWAKNCTGFCGTATPSNGSSLSTVQVSIQRSGGGYWTGSAFTGAAEQFLSATGSLATWQIPFPFGNFADGDYVLHVVTTDTAGRTASTTSTFRVDATPPAMVDVQAVNRSGGTAGRIEAGDTLELTYSEPIDPASVVTGWTGVPSQPIVARISRGTPDRITFWTSGGAAIPLGTVTLSGANGYFNKTPVDLAATLTVSGNGVVVTLGNPITSGAQTNQPLNAAGTMSWVSGPVRDLLGNSLAGSTPVSEQGPADVEF
ncbi:hypothetical protein BJY16_002232 [Actinoplanes octamycinicus]|uniref:Fibronectin type-III domain-containing protein n=1 Tax=Actinoplanes octamycinicus TaxID=135948 RepID=A0A7W7GUY2_9ACTN|nr:hypothetical protein [Actinoplanes octamycinicus]MBB4738773.1 hypothetical protein [Actinoplanes octamycinicus]GIE61505.1 hypothetical protein Aoc01nite_69070 [Actinoplanes octamycinicus]